MLAPIGPEHQRRPGIHGQPPGLIYSLVQNDGTNCKCGGEKVA
jgi:hypothetical protein